MRIDRRALRPIRGVLVLAAIATIFGCTPPAASTSAARPSDDVEGGGDWVLHPVVDGAESAPCALRIVSAAPVITEICFALGVDDCVVGRTRFCAYPPQVAEIPSIGSLTDANVELLLSLRPELILLSGTSRDQTDRFRAMNLRFESIPDATLEDVFSAIERVGALVGRPRTAASLAERIREELSSAARAFPVARPQRVLLLTGTLQEPPQPPYVAGPGSFYDDLIALGGHENVVKSSAAFAPLSLEAILEADPDVIIELDADGTARPAGDASALAAWSAFDALRAVRDQRVRVLSGPEHFLPGPRVALVARELWRAIATGAPQ